MLVAFHYFVFEVKHHPVTLYHLMYVKYFVKNNYLKYLIQCIYLFAGFVLQQYCCTGVFLPCNSNGCVLCWVEKPGKSFWGLWGLLGLLGLWRLWWHSWGCQHNCWFTSSSCSELQTTTVLVHTSTYLKIVNCISEIENIRVFFLYIVGLSSQHTHH